MYHCTTDIDIDNNKDSNNGIDSNDKMLRLNLDFHCRVIGVECIYILLFMLYIVFFRVLYILYINKYTLHSLIYIVYRSVYTGEGLIYTTYKLLYIMYIRLLNML